jgi:hypothetical protein
MGFEPNEPEQRRQLRAALNASALAPGELWLNYFSIGGSVGEYEVEAYLQGLLSLPPIQRDLLAMAANELIEATPRLYAPYSDDPNLTGSGMERDAAETAGDHDTADDTRDRSGSDEQKDPPGTD